MINKIIFKMAGNAPKKAHAIRACIGILSFVVGLYFKFTTPFLVPNALILIGILLFVLSIILYKYADA
jgi:hypothetical protein